MVTMPKTTEQLEQIERTLADFVRMLNEYRRLKEYLARVETSALNFDVVVQWDIGRSLDGYDLAVQAVKRRASVRIVDFVRDEVAYREKILRDTANAMRLEFDP